MVSLKPRLSSRAGWYIPAEDQDTTRVLQGPSAVRGLAGGIVMQRMLY